jgi:putative sterol carrier protein
MPPFPSKAWCEEAIRLLNADPEVPDAGAGWEGDFGAIVEAEPGRLARPFCVHVTPRNGRIERFEVVPDADDFDEIEPAYLARAPYSVWKQMIRGELEPMEALLKRRIAVRGDLQPLIERIRYSGIAERVLARLDTKFVDES